MRTVGHLSLAIVTVLGCAASHEADEVHHAVGERRDAGTVAPRQVIQIALGASRSCALRADGTVACWGADALDWGAAPSLVPVDVVGVVDAIDVAIGCPDESPSSTCIVRRGGRVSCWGNNRDGQLGDGTTVESAVPVDVVGIDDAFDVSIGATTSCAARADGRVSCWGSPALGIRPLDSPSTATDVPGLEGRAVAVEATQSHVCALLASGAVACWGYNVENQLGRPGPSEGGVDESSVALTVPEVRATQLSVAGGYSFPTACRVDVMGAVACWGQDFWESSMLHFDLHPVPGIDHAIAFTSNAGVGCALRDDGSVVCLGERGGASAMGIGLEDETSGAAYVPASLMHLPANDAIQVELGTYEHVCVLRANGDVYCAGHNEFGQLGDGTTITRTEPVRVVGLSVE